MRRKKKVKAYVRSGKYERLLTRDVPGDFHMKEPATYFSYSEEYCKAYAKKEGERVSSLSRLSIWTCSSNRDNTITSDVFPTMSGET
jgi:hypothetical protein